MSQKVLIICASYHHQNTKKICDAFAEEMDAVVVNADEFNESMLDDFDLIGFGSGIYNGQHHKSIMDLVSKLSFQDEKRTFIFSTSTFALTSMHKQLENMLRQKGFIIIAELACKGFMDYSFTKYLFGGINKGRPNESDIEQAKAFANRLKGRIND